jgi:Family of unknown function (DUF6868)
MDIQSLTRFFMWCTIINGSLLVFWSVMIMLAPDLVYRTQVRFLPISRETYNVVMYFFVGLFKFMFLIFNFVPYIALNIIG